MLPETKMLSMMLDVHFCIQNYFFTLRIHQ
jgi:hypothetical protein